MKPISYYKVQKYKTRIQEPSDF